MKSGDLLNRLVRRALVLVLTVAVIGAGVATVQVAARWTAESAPIDAAPAGLDTIAADAAVEADRASGLSAQADDVASQIADLGGALTTANQAISADSDHASGMQQQLKQARTRLQALQKQLKAAQARLDALNAAAARQAAANAAARSGSPTSVPAYSEHDHEGGGGDD